MSEIYYKCPGCGQIVSDNMYPDHLKTGHVSGVKKDIEVQTPNMTAPRRPGMISQMRILWAKASQNDTREGLIYWTLIMLMVGFILGWYV